MAKDIDRVLSEMEYGGRSKVLALGIYKGFQYVVRNTRGSHPCGYVNISGYESVLRNENNNLTEYETERYGWIDCHGGVTFADTAIWPFAGGYWVGWDYAHLGDRCQYSSFVTDGMMYGTGCVVYECKHVIDQIVDRLNEKGVKIRNNENVFE